MKQHLKSHWKGEWGPARGAGKDGSGKKGISLQKGEAEAPAEGQNMEHLRTRVKNTHGRRQWAKQAQEAPTLPPLSVI